MQPSLVIVVLVLLGVSIIEILGMYCLSWTDNSKTTGHCATRTAAGVPIPRPENAGRNAGKTPEVGTLLSVPQVTHNVQHSCIS